MDSFTDEIKTFMETENVASMPDHVFKTLIIKKVQIYSTEIELRNERISELFLSLTDLIVSGNLSKMPSDALKVYTALALLCNSKEPPTRVIPKLSKLTGMEDELILKKALDELKSRGYIDSVDEPVIKKVKSAKEARSQESDLAG